MSRRKVLFLAGLAAMVLLAVLGCSLLVRDETGVPAGAGGSIQIRIQAPAAAKGITVTDFDVTGMNIQVLDPQDLPLASIDWVLADGTQSYPVPVQQAGEHEVVVTHYGERDGQQVQATERAACNIQAMKITVIDIVPGCIGVIRVEGGEPPEPADLTGYWDAILTPEGGTPNPPHLLYFKQTGSSLDGSGAITGTVEGSTVTFDLGGTEVIAAIAPGGTIALGTIEMWGETYTAELRRSVLDFGTFALSGMIGLDTDRGLGSKGDDTVSHHLDFHVQAGALQGTMSFWSATPLTSGIYSIVPTHGGNPGPNEVGALFFENWETVYDAESGTLTLGRNDSTGASGSFAVQFDGGNSLNGSFELNPPQYNGVVTISGGFWNGYGVSAETASGRIWSAGPQVDWGECRIDYLDENLSIELELNSWFGPIGTGTYLVPDQASVQVFQGFDDGSGLEDRALSGTMVITSYEEGVGIAGYFENMVFPGGTLTGSFDVSFELDEYE